MTLMNDRKCKVCLIGDASVGKTCLIIRFDKGTFNLNTENTIGAAFLTKIVKTSRSMVNLSIWDTAGQERYRSLVPRYFAGTLAFVIVFDVSCRESFDSAKKWLDDVRNHSGSNCKIFFVANKFDKKPQFDLSIAEDFSKSESLEYFVTSALTGEGVQPLFYAIAEAVNSLIPPDENSSLDIGQTEVHEKSDCSC